MFNRLNLEGGCGFGDSCPCVQSRAVRESAGKWDDCGRGSALSGAPQVVCGSGASERTGCQSEVRGLRYGAINLTLGRGVAQFVCGADLEVGAGAE
jgi:hypothetical protein